MDKSPRFSSEVAKKYLQEQSLRSSQGRSLGEDYYEFTPYAHDERVGEFNSQHRLVGGIIERFVQSILDAYLSHLRRGTLLHCYSPAGEAFKKNKNHVISMGGRWGDPGLVQKCVFLHVTNLSHFL